MWSSCKRTAPINGCRNESALATTGAVVAPAAANGQARFVLGACAPKMTFKTVYPAQVRKALVALASTDRTMLKWISLFLSKVGNFWRNLK